MTFFASYVRFSALDLINSLLTSLLVLKLAPWTWTTRKSCTVRLKHVLRLASDPQIHICISSRRTSWYGVGVFSSCFSNVSPRCFFQWRLSPGTRIIDFLTIDRTFLERGSRRLTQTCAHNWGDRPGLEYHKCPICPWLASASECDDMNPFVIHSFYRSPRARARAWAYPYRRSHRA